MPNLNATIDRFAAKALELNFPLTIINHADGPHAFDLFDDSEGSRNAIRQILDFIQVQLAGTE